MVFKPLDDSYASKTLAAWPLAQAEQKKGLRFLEDRLSIICMIIAWQISLKSLRHLKLQLRMQ